MVGEATAEVAVTSVTEQSPKRLDDSNNDTGSSSSSMVLDVCTSNVTDGVDLRIGSSSTSMMEVAVLQQHQTRVNNFFKVSVTAQSKPTAPIKIRNAVVSSQIELCEKAQEIEASLLTDLSRQRSNTIKEPIKTKSSKAPTCPSVKTQIDRIALVKGYDEANNLHNASFLSTNSKFGIRCSACDSFYTDMSFVFVHADTIL